METEKVENLILGGGEAGKYIAWELAREGRRTVVVERALIGGSCPNIACLPSKNVIRSAKIADLLRHAADYGLQTGPVATDMQGIRRRKREMVDGMIGRRAGDRRKRRARRCRPHTQHARDWP